MEKEKKKEKEEKKSHVWLITILVICLMAVCGLFGWLAGASYFAFNENAPKQEIKEEVQEETKKEETTTAEAKNLTEADVSNYMSRLKSFVSFFGKEIPIETASISNQDKLYYAYNTIKSVPFTKAKADETIHGLFGKDYQYTPEDINCPVEGHKPMIKYYQDKETFDFNPEHGGHGGGSFVRVEALKFASAEEKGDTLTIKVKIIYGGTCGDICGPVTDYYARYPFNESIYAVDEGCYHQGSCTNIEDVYEQVKEQLPTTVFTFRKQSDGNFGLTKVEVE